MSDEEDIDENWSLPPRQLRPLPQVAKLTEERDRLHALLVKACVEIARRMIDESPLTLTEITACIKDDYGIVLVYTREGWTEDTTK